MTFKITSFKRDLRLNNNNNLIFRIFDDEIQPAGLFCFFFFNETAIFSFIDDVFSASSFPTDPSYVS
jgi:hypothetical protein